MYTYSEWLALYALTQDKPIARPVRRRLEAGGRIKRDPQTDHYWIRQDVLKCMCSSAPRCKVDFSGPRPARYLIPILVGALS